MAAPRAPYLRDLEEKRRHAWVLLFGCGALLVFSALYWLAQGRPFDRGAYEIIGGAAWGHLFAFDPASRSVVSAIVRGLGGNMGLIAGVLVMIIAANGYRCGERWTWYAMWVLPLEAAIDLATLAGYDALTPTSAAWDIGIFLLAMTGLVLPYATFFPEEALALRESRRPRALHARASRPETHRH